MNVEDDLGGVIEEAVALPRGDTIEQLPSQERRDVGRRGEGVF
jgi:hypothetical protein